MAADLENQTVPGFAPSSLSEQYARTPHSIATAEQHNNPLGVRYSTARHDQHAAPAPAHESIAAY